MALRLGDGGEVIDMGADWIQQEQCLEQEWYEVRERIEANVRKNEATGCWLWQAGVDGCGYGQLRVNGPKEKAHRAAYRIFKGDIPPGMCVCHTCDTPACCNPDHLFLGTAKDNAVDRASKGRGGYLKGTANGRAKLTDSDVVFIRSSCMTGAALGRMFGISKNMACRIKTGKAWTHLQEKGNANP